MYEEMNLLSVLFLQFSSGSGSRGGTKAVATTVVVWVVEGKFLFEDFNLNVSHANAFCTHKDI